ncbi:hypothetical protein DFR37_12423 [Eoetvoesiella caeni]|uniref:Uncharacterized protein n=1 Tax=Eoetvoesiella caeni TaxID=645616 RepID=A0A366H180_9BURK|nr:hypothetical protein DFR37_12423 [Eoetvoesiella caeni]
MKILNLIRSGCASVVLLAGLYPAMPSMAAEPIRIGSVLSTTGPAEPIRNFVGEAYYAR